MAVQPLKVLIDHLREGPKTLPLDHRPEWFDLKDDAYAFVGAVTGAVTFALVGRDVQGHGGLKVTVETPCVRCLAPVRLELRVPVDEVWLWRSAEREVSPLDPAGVEDIVSYYEGEELDVAETLRELIMAALPDYPRCRADCKGLCPGCGANLNVETCRCRGAASPEAADVPEWKRALRRFGEHPAS